jgi:hypothetical protein
MGLWSNLVGVADFGLEKSPFLGNCPNRREIAETEVVA